MPEPTVADGAELLALQRALATLAFTADPGLMAQDPAAFARAQGLPERDQAAFLRYRERLWGYRRFVRDNLAEPIQEGLPITTALLERERCWEPCFGRFLEEARVTSPFLRDTAATFLGWLATSGWGQERWPFLLELAHSELVLVLVGHHPVDPAESGLHPQPGPDDRLVLAPGAQVLSYRHGVHLARPEHPDPGPDPVRLLVFRDAEGWVRRLELTPASAALLVAAQTQALAPAARALGLADPAPALAQMADLCARGAILGFRS